MSKPIPTIGRIVHYKSRGSADFVFEPECRAAVITAVHSDDLVSLAVLNPNGLYFNPEVRLGNDPGDWHWPERTD